MDAPTMKVDIGADPELMARLAELTEEVKALRAQLVAAQLLTQRFDLVGRECAADSHVIDVTRLQDSERRLAVAATGRTTCDRCGRAVPEAPDDLCDQSAPKISGSEPESRPARASTTGAPNERASGSNRCSEA